MVDGVQWPGPRGDLVNALQLLCDTDLHDRWRAGEKTWPDFTEAVHWLIDDTWLDHGPALERIPELLANQDEAMAIDQAASALIGLLDDLGPHTPDSAYLVHPGWPEVVRTACAALRVMGEPNHSVPIEPPPSV